ncbi:MAG: hypothetical protein MUD15_07285, partial [Desulfobacterota bacterium]|nr:hypothetical protein [Thermodesulfobacteriota bacterium]
MPNRFRFMINLTISFFFLAFVMLPVSAKAADQEEPTAEKVAAELANPLAPVTTLNANFRAEFNNGPDDDTNYQVRLQPSFFKPFTDKSALLVRTIIPFRSTNWPTNDTGLGDITIAPYYVPDITKAVFFGLGGALIMPTATEDALGTKKWSTGPAMIFAKTGQPVTWGALAQHIWSFAGDSERGNVSVSTLQPFCTYLLGGGWSSTLTSETNYNWKADSDEWTVPVLLSLAKVVKLGEKYVNIGV